MKLTWDLYRCSPNEWAQLSWKYALEVRISKATQAKAYYKKKADSLDDKFGTEYTKLLKLYAASNKARLFNISLQNEVK